MDRDISWDEMVAFVSNEIDDATRETLAARIASSPELTRRVARLQRLTDTMAGDATTPPTERAVQRARALTSQSRNDIWTQWLASARKVVAELVFDSRRPAFQVGLRGDPGLQHLAYESSAGRLDLRVTPPDPPGRRWRVRGQVAGLGESNTALLMTPGTGEVVAGAELDGSGQFKIETRPGRYDLNVLIDATSRLLVPDIDVGDEDAG